MTSGSCRAPVFLICLCHGPRLTRRVSRSPGVVAPLRREDRQRNACDWETVIGAYAQKERRGSSDKEPDHRNDRQAPRTWRGEHQHAGREDHCRARHAEGWDSRHTQMLSRVDRRVDERVRDEAPCHRRPCVAPGGERQAPVHDSQPEEHGGLQKEQRREPQAAWLMRVKNPT